MLTRLKDYINMGVIKDLLSESSEWDSLIVNRRKPHTYRVFYNTGMFRICLHKFDTCDTEESFKHPHPWPAAFTVLKGSYLMGLGRSEDKFSNPESVATMLMKAGSAYEMVDPLTWHFIVPLEETYTIMINGEPYREAVAHTSVRRTGGKDLDKMPEDELKLHLAKFSEMLEGYTL